MPREGAFGNLPSTTLDNISFVSWWLQSPRLLYLNHQDAKTRKGTASFTRD